MPIIRHIPLCKPTLNWSRLDEKSDKRLSIIESNSSFLKFQGTHRPKVNMPALTTLPGMSSRLVELDNLFGLLQSVKHTQKTLDPPFATMLTEEIRPRVWVLLSSVLQGIGMNTEEHENSSGIEHSKAMSTHRWSSFAISGTLREE